MNHEEIRAVALEKAVEVFHEIYGNDGDTNPDAEAVRFVTETCTRFLAAINEKAEPVAWRTHHDEPMLFPTRAEALDYCADDEPPIPLYEHPTIEPAPTVDYEYDLSKCPNCGGSADNGHDRCYPPNPYYCKRCMKEEQTEPAPQEPLGVTEGTATPVGAAPLPDAQLCRFYDVDNFPDLVAAMDHHIEKLQAKLPPTPSLKPTRVREG